jgi:ribonuclease VapC
VVIDSSAILAILQKEPEAAAFTAAVSGASERYISAVSALEASIAAMSKRGMAGAQNVEDFITGTALQIVPFDTEQLAIARSAYQRYGRGRHPARLNFGDCAAYALAKSLGQPLLFKGGDFAQTDISPAA